jgi:hypothetical protein
MKKIITITVMIIICFNIQAYAWKRQIKTKTKITQTVVSTVCSSGYLFAILTSSTGDMQIIQVWENKNTAAKCN